MSGDGASCLSRAAGAPVRCLSSKHNARRPARTNAVPVHSVCKALSVSQRLGSGIWSFPARSDVVSWKAKQDISTLEPIPSENRRPYFHSLEPPSLYDSFLAHPPEGFEARRLSTSGGTVPIFRTRFDLLTTLDETVKRWVYRIPLFKTVSRVALCPWVLFCGTTVSEYTVMPTTTIPADLVRAVLVEMKASRSTVAIIKDVPDRSPLLTEEENAVAAQLLAACRAEGMAIVEGQALAYVPIDFKTEEEYLARFSGKRRYDFRRKLKSRPQVQRRILPTGDPQFSDDLFVDALYAMYESVYRQSEIHFDKLSRSFFADVFRCSKSDGLVFLYRSSEKMIGWKLCFVHGGNLIDKYVGFVYPAAHETHLYFLSWFDCLAYAVQHRLENYVVGWTDAAVKSYLGARFTLTRHAVYLRNPLLRGIFQCFQRYFESDAKLVSVPDGGGVAT